MAQRSFSKSAIQLCHSINF